MSRYSRLTSAWLCAAVCLSMPAAGQQKPDVEILPSKIEIVAVRRADWNRSTPEQAYRGVRAAHLADVSGAQR